MMRGVRNWHGMGGVKAVSEGVVARWVVIHAKGPSPLTCNAARPETSSDAPLLGLAGLTTRAVVPPLRS